MSLRISRDGAEIGEWSEEDVAALYRDGQLLATDYYWKPGMPDWALLATFVQPPPPPAPKLPPLPAALKHQGFKLRVAVGCYVIVGTILASICAGDLHIAAILGTWIADAAFSGVFWIVYLKCAKPTRLKSFLVFAGISVGMFLTMLLGKYGSSH